MLLPNFRVSALALTLTTGLIAAGCGANASLSPTGPSNGTSARSTLISESVASTGEVAAPSGKGDHGRGDADGGHQDDKGKGGDKGREGDKDNGVEANGRITSVNAAARTLRIGTHQVSVPTTATIRHGSKALAFTDLKVGDHVEVKGRLNATAVLVASEVKVEQQGEADDDDDDEVTPPSTSPTAP